MGMLCLECQQAGALTPDETIPRTSSGPLLFPGPGLQRTKKACLLPQFPYLSS